jgi:hypothetical protein
VFKSGVSIEIDRSGNLCRFSNLNLNTTSADFNQSCFWTYRKISARDGIADFVIFAASVYVTP